MVMPLNNDATISGGGLVNDADQIMHYIDDKAYFGGTAVKYNTAKTDSNGRPWVTVAGHTDRPIGFTLRSTYLSRVPYEYGIASADFYESDVPMPVRRYREGDEISVPLCAGHSAIAKGDKIGIRAVGEHDKFSDISGCVYSLGIAMTEAADDTADGGVAGVNAECIVIRVQFTQEV
jgi:hypothetical protein